MVVTRDVFLKEIAKESGELLSRYFGSDVDIRKKQVNDLVTEADEAVERLLVERIREAFPDDAILAEEGGQKHGNNNFEWIIDPIDGTTNFAHTFPQCSISIALANDRQAVAAVVYDPIKNEFFEAQRDQGAFLNGRPLQASKCAKLADALVVTGFSYDRRERMDLLLERVRRILMNAQGLRRLGSAALDLCYIAAGRFDVYIEDGLSPWDMAAGQLIASEAGATLRSMNGDAYDLYGDSVVACPEHMLREVLEKLCQ